jgi:WD40 repeat protein
VSADGSIAVSGGYDGTVRLWDVATGHRVGLLEAPESRVVAVAVSGDAFVVAAGHSSGVVAIWQLEWDYPAGVPGQGVSRP